MHIDHYIDSEDSNSYISFVFYIHRLRASLKVKFKEGIKETKLFCSYRNTRYKVTGASAMGDIYLHRDFETNYGYTVRVNLLDCTDFSKLPSKPTNEKERLPLMGSVEDIELDIRSFSEGHELVEPFTALCDEGYLYSIFYPSSLSIWLEVNSAWHEIYNLAACWFDINQDKNKNKVTFMIERDSIEQTEEVGRLSIGATNNFLVESKAFNFEFQAAMKSMEKSPCGDYLQVNLILTGELSRTLKQ